MLALVALRLLFRDRPPVLETPGRNLTVLDFLRLGSLPRALDCERCRHVSVEGSRR